MVESIEVSDYTKEISNMQQGYVIPLSEVSRKVFDKFPIEQKVKQKPRAKCTGKLSAEDVDYIRALLKLSCSEAVVGRLYKVQNCVIHSIKMNDIHNKHKSQFQINTYEVLSFDANKFSTWLKENHKCMQRKICSSDLTDKDKSVLIYKLNKGVKSLSY